MRLLWPRRRLHPRGVSGKQSHPDGDAGQGGTSMRTTAAAVIGLCTLLLATACGSSTTKSDVPPEHTLSATLTPRQVVTPAGKAFAVPAALAGANGAFSATVDADN